MGPATGTIADKIHDPLQNAFVRAKSIPFRGISCCHHMLHFVLWRFLESCNHLPCSYFSQYYPFSISLNYNRESVEGYIRVSAQFFPIVAFIDHKIPNPQVPYFYRWSLEEKYKIYYVWTVKACKKPNFFFLGISTFSLWMIFFSSNPFPQLCNFEKSYSSQRFPYHSEFAPF